MHITDHLKKATVALHRQTENLLPTYALMDGSLNLESYTQLIRVQYLIFQNLEQHFSNQLKLYPPLDNYYTYKTPWLKEDLKALDCSLPFPLDHLHMPMEKHFLIGLLYVVEGSMLGGQHILQGLKKSAALTNLPHRFYHGYGKETGIKWKSFKALADEMATTAEIEKVISGAEYGFLFFQENFKHQLPSVMH